MPGPTRKAETFENEVIPPRLERTLAEFDERLGKARAVTRPGRAAWSRDVDAVRVPTHRMVFRTSGGTVGKREKAALSVDQQGAVRLLRRDAGALRTLTDQRRNRYAAALPGPEPDGGTTGLANREIRAVRELLDLIRPVTDPEKD